MAMESRNERTEYLLVVQAPCYRVDERTFATESAFAEHLRVLQKKLFPRFKRLWIAAPQHTDQFYRENHSHLGHVAEQQDHIFYVALTRTDVSTWRFWTKGAFSAWRALRERTKHSEVVHSGLAMDVWRPIPLMAGIAARLDSCKTLFVVDIDFRKHAWRLWRTGQWSLKSYVVCSFIYDPIRLAQMWFATRTSSLSLLKGASMVRDFGRGRQNVRNFWDTAHSLEQVIDKSALKVRMRRLEDSERPISLIYFGRFVPYKGLDRMIRAVWRARCISGRPFVLDLVGNGADLARLRDCVNELGAREAIRFNDPLPYGESLFAKIREADLLLATPLTEDTPRSAFDAMASGLPILGFDIDYYDSLAKESNAVETSPWPEVDAFAARIVALDIDRDRLVRMSRAAVEFARANTQEIWIRRRVEWTLSLLDSSK
jgi:glycosyltransferase involved in cell wall biosynthesis